MQLQFASPPRSHPTVRITEDQSLFVNLNLLAQPPPGSFDTLEHQAAALTSQVVDLVAGSSSRFPRPTKKPWISPSTRQLIDAR
eukprot:5940564-Prorocentrum_lima.AAC.1